MDKSDCFRVALNRHGEQATYAQFGHAPAEIVYTVRGESSPQRTRDSIQVAPDQHVVDTYAQFINHSFEPNLEVRGRELVAIRAIAAGDEITFNYLASESAIVSPFICHETGQPVGSNALPETAHSSRG